MEASEHLKRMVQLSNEAIELSDLISHAPNGFWQAIHDLRDAAQMASLYLVATPPAGERGT